MPRFFAALLALTLVVVPLAGPANAADGVDLDTSLFNSIDVPVPDSPVLIHTVVNNVGTTSATNVVVQLPVPTGASVVSFGGNCSAASAVITCAFPSVAAGQSEGATLFLTFEATGTYAVTSSARGPARYRRQ